MDHRAGLLEVDAGAEVVAAEANGRNAQAGFSEIADFHDVTPWGMVMVECRRNRPGGQSALRRPSIAASTPRPAA